MAQAASFFDGKGTQQKPKSRTEPMYSWESVLGMQFCRDSLSAQRLKNTPQVPAPLPCQHVKGAATHADDRSSQISVYIPKAQTETVLKPSIIQALGRHLPGM